MMCRCCAEVINCSWWYFIINLWWMIDAVSPLMQNVDVPLFVAGKLCPADYLLFAVIPAGAEFINYCGGILLVLMIGAVFASDTAVMQWCILVFYVTGRGW